MLKHLSNPTPYMILIAGLLLLDYVQNNAKREACPPTRSSQEIHSPRFEPAARSDDDFCHNNNNKQPCIGPRP